MKKPLGRRPLHGTRMVQRTVGLPREVWERLRAEAAARGVQVSVVVRERLGGPPRSPRGGTSEPP